MSHPYYKETFQHWDGGRINSEHLEWRCLTQQGRRYELSRSFHPPIHSSTNIHWVPTSAVLSATCNGSRSKKSLFSLVEMYFLTPKVELTPRSLQRKMWWDQIWRSKRIWEKWLGSEYVKEQVVVLPPVPAPGGAVLRTSISPAAGRAGTWSRLVEQGWCPSCHPVLSRPSSVRAPGDVADWQSYQGKPTSRVPVGSRGVICLQSKDHRLY